MWGLTRPGLKVIPWGVSPGVWFRRGPWGVAVAPPISPYTWPVWYPPICRVALELRSVFPIFLCDIPHISMAIFLSVSLPRISHRVQFLGRLTSRVIGLTLCPPPRSSRTLSFALTYSPDSLILMHPAIDIVWRCPCFPRLRLLWPLAIAVRLVVFRPGWLLTLSLTGSWVEPSCNGRLLCLRLGWRTVPFSHFQDSVNIPDRLSMQ